MCPHVIPSSHWSLPNLSSTSLVSRGASKQKSPVSIISPVGYLSKHMAHSLTPIYLVPTIARRPGNGAFPNHLLSWWKTRHLSPETPTEIKVLARDSLLETIHTTDLLPRCQTSASSVITWPVGLQRSVLIPQGQWQVKFSILRKFNTSSRTGGYSCTRQLSSKRGDLEPLNSPDQSHMNAQGEHETAAGGAPHSRFNFKFSRIWGTPHFKAVHSTPPLKTSITLFLKYPA